MTHSADTLALVPGNHQRLERDQVRFAALLEEITRTLAASAPRYDRSGEFPADNFALPHRHGLLGLTVPRAVARGEPSTALILVMQYLQHFRLQQNPGWPAHLRRQVGLDAVHNGALINAFRVEQEFGAPARGGLPATLARRTAEGWRLSGRKIYSTGSHGLTWYLVHRAPPDMRIVEGWDHLGMRATRSHEVRFDEVLIPLDHAVGVSPWSAPRPELDGQGLRWMALLLPAIHDGVVRAARDWLQGFLECTPSNLGAALSSLPRFQEMLGRIDTLLFANRTLLDCAAFARTREAGQ